MKNNVDIRAGYRVPEGYFENFSERMSLAVSQMENSGNRRISAKYIRLAVSSVAAVAAVVILSITLFGNVSAESDSLTVDFPITMLSRVSENQIIDYYSLLSDSTGISSIQDDVIINYVSSTGSINPFTLID